MTETYEFNFEKKNLTGQEKNEVFIKETSWENSVTFVSKSPNTESYHFQT